ncbi:metal ABC transporter substrate-binding protein [Erysipelothrix aquatica]|uniref:metal ABC transporter substrate-binding protein n=1 Tax=Erysipelothrix aquatica TaxID=2683714 RepID=UPI001359AE0C|nr:metal ABC transporter substrate-binding protein [Erysipelothrix aquatica]
MKRLLALLATTSLMFLAGCQAQQKPDITVTSFIGYDIAHAIVGDKMVVENIMPWGSEMHNFEPSARNITAIKDSKLFIFVGEDQEPWVKTLGTQDHALDLSKSYELAAHNHAHSENHEDTDHQHDEAAHTHEEETKTHETTEHDHSHEKDHSHEGHEHDHGSLHYWTDPTTYVQLIESVKKEIIKVDPTNATYYETQASAYSTRITTMHTDFDQYMQSQDHPTVYFSGHNAMDAFADRYHLKIVSLTQDYRPNADLTAQQILSLKTSLKDAQATTLFIEELVEPRVAKSIQDSLRQDNIEIEIKELHGYHNISHDQFKAHVTYADLMHQNIENLKHAINH